MQLGGSYTVRGQKVDLKFGEVFLTSVDSGIFLAYLLFFPLHQTLQLLLIFFFLSPSPCSPLFISLYHFLFPTKIPQYFLFPGYSSLYTLKTNFNSSSDFFCFSQQELLSIVVTYSKQILVMASPPFLEKQLKVFIEAVGGRVTIEGLFLSLLRNHLDQQGDSCRKAQNCRMWSLWLPAAFASLMRNYLCTHVLSIALCLTMNCCC